MTGLHRLRPAPVQRESRPDLAWSTRLATLAVAIHFFVSSNLLYLAGIAYDVPGGNPLVKFHPSTYLIAVAAILAARERRDRPRSPRDIGVPATAIFVVAMLLCSVFSGVSIGTRGAAVFIENFVSAGLLAYVLEGCLPRERQAIGRLMLALCLANVVVAVAETITHQHVITPYLGAVEFKEGEGDFRGTAGFDHPLTGASITMLALLCLGRLRLPVGKTYVSFCVLCLGLLAFGGRTALALSLITLICLTLIAIIRSLASGRLPVQLLAASLLSTILVLPAGYVVLTQTPVGERLASHLFIDESATTREVQWRVLDHISFRNTLFGVPEDDIPFLIQTVNLDERLGAIENPWLLIFLKLGVVGSAIFLSGLMTFLVHLWMRSSLAGRAVIIAGLTVISSSNSIGVKTEVFFLFTAFVICGEDFAAARRSVSPVQRSASRRDFARLRNGPAHHLLSEGEAP
jgi:hypothetical protein